jgi:hypothetical protein
MPGFLQPRNGPEPPPDYSMPREFRDQELDQMFRIPEGMSNEARAAALAVSALIRTSPEHLRECGMKMADLGARTVPILSTVYEVQHWGSQLDG